MAYTATTNLSLPIITTGTESGTWGDVVDNGLTAYLDIAIAGGLAIAITTADVTLTKTAGTNAATGIVSTTAQYAILNITGAKTAARNLNLPITSKSYIINNAGTGGFLLTVRGVTPTTGVTLVDGEECIVAWNGSDFVKVASTVITALSGTLGTANGGTGSTSTTYASLTANVTGTLPIANGGTGSTSTTYASLTANVTGTLPVANGGTGVTTSTGTTNVVLSNSPTLVTPNINSAQFATVSGTAPLYAARAWVNFNGTGTPAIRASGNVSSITDNGTGDYTVNFTTAMSDADYSIGHIVGDTTGSAQAFLTPFTYATGSIRIQIFNAASVAVDRNAVNISIFR